MHKFWILQVEDDENDVRLLQFAMESAGFPDCLRTANSGQAALDYFEGRGDYADRGRYPLPHLVLLDLRLPRLNGLEVLRWLRGHPRFCHIVVIMFTASAHPDDISQACALGANAFVQKPSTHAELIKFLQCLRGFWFEFHQFPSQGTPRISQEVTRPELNP